jgi:hypothetical protein
MDLYEENTLALKDLWVSERDRQNAKLVVTVAIAQATELTAKETLDVLSALDRILLAETPDAPTRPDPAI